MTNVDKSELIAVLEEIRTTKYSQIPATLIKDINIAQFENLDNRGKGRTDMRKLVDDFMKTVSVEDNA